MKPGQRFRRPIAILVGIAMVVAVLLVWRHNVNSDGPAGDSGGGKSGGGKSGGGKSGASEDAKNVSFNPDEVYPSVVAFCGDCHAVPTPDQFPRNGWPEEIEQGYGFYFDSGRNDLKLPPKRSILQYYRALAPVSLPLLPAAMSLPAGPLTFKPQPIALPDSGQDAQPAVANVAWMGKQRLGSLPRQHQLDRLLVCDMRAGSYAEVTLLPGQQPVIGRSQKVGFPSHTALVDFDRDGQLEVLVADLGSFLPADHDKGRVLLLRPTGQDPPFEVNVLSEGHGRVTDIRPGDFDGDGDVDLLVAEFGWRTTGRIFLMENIENGSVPKFRERVLDDRHGCIHLPTADLNNDGHLDFVAVMSQEHELVDAFINRGDGTFRRQQIFSANNPSFGSSGVELTDLDQDGDFDVLYTNGDMFDGFYVVPYHGIRWVENRNGQWVDHRLASMPGVHRAVAADMDNDGDLDVVACALVSNRSMAGRGQKGLDSLIWLEQVSPGKFQMRSIEAERCFHASLDVADFDGDDDLDIAVGEFRENAGTAHLTIWWNQLVKQRQPTTAQE